MKKIIYKIITIITIIMILPLRASAADYWTGNSVYKPEEHGNDWNVAASQILKVTSPGRAYSLDDIDSYSAYITNEEERVGFTIDKSFYWYNKSRLAYVKLFKVTGGQEISFVFSDEFYVYCAEFNSSYEMSEDGDWFATGQKCRLANDTEWIMLVFRQVNGDTSLGGGVDTTVSASAIKNSDTNYVVFEPFCYTFKMNGGNYYGSTEDYQINRIGVSKVSLPIPIRAGYRFAGWKADNGVTYNSGLPQGYDSTLFKDTTFTAVWQEIPVSGISLDNEYVILEQNCNDKITLNATLTPGSAPDKTVTWSSSDTTVATVDAQGVVTAGKTGEAVITVTAASGVSASCKVYVMGFEVKIPSSCRINETYPIEINVYNNGTEGMIGRKHIILDTEPTVEVYRVGDETTVYDVVAESATSYRGSYEKLQTGNYLADTMDSATIYYRLTPKNDINRAGDYKGNVNFSVIIN